jgi:hypothetical protein
VIGLAGTVLGLLLLSIGLFRAGVGPRWVGPALWAFLVVEFIGSAISPRASYLSGVLFLAAFGALAVEAVHSWRDAPVGTRTGTDQGDAAVGGSALTAESSSSSTTQ